ncbi:MAG TPA: site-2 protease family protein [Peptococcaceae bacterium]|jgi:Zn-dependent protease|nr:site-2 protease family protein [Clostridia bacterium]HOB82743.1 site-2 protease family protein [Peptococcaceae bacterium]HPZ71423.1 site-2 protease family protein [Peptococcaceae bacterium]HQD54516.1 site-2 protease family protein [Peptococcaceae bacterium]
MFDANFWRELMIRLPVILIALSFHEFAHAYTAYRLGDNTPKYQGRLTLNPLAHLDPVGTLMIIFGPFGWAKPVMINPLNFRGSKRKGSMLVSLAGPLSNLIIAVIAAVLLHLVVSFDTNVFWPTFFQSLVIINIGLAFFNLVPVPPLDGSKILAGLLPYHMRNVIYNLEMYGPIILIMLIVTGAIGTILTPLIIGVYNFIIMITSIFSLL